MQPQSFFPSLDLVFQHTTSIALQGEGGETIGQKGFSKNHRSALNQVVDEVVLDDHARPLCCEVWLGNTTGVKVLVLLFEQLRERFDVGRFCVVADRGAVSAQTSIPLEDRKNAIL